MKFSKQIEETSSSRLSDCHDSSSNAKGSRRGIEKVDVRKVVSGNVAGNCRLQEIAVRLILSQLFPGSFVCAILSPDYQRPKVELAFHRRDFIATVSQLFGSHAGTCNKRQKEKKKKKTC